MFHFVIIVFIKYILHIEDSSLNFRFNLLWLSQWTKNTMKAGGLRDKGKWIETMTFCLKKKNALALLTGIFNACS